MVDTQLPPRPFMAEHPIHSSETVQYLNDDEISQFLDCLDHSGKGYIEYDDVEQKLDHVHDELALKPGSHHVMERTHDTYDDRVRHQFLRGLMGSDAQRIPRDEFTNIVREWGIPSLEQCTREEQGEKNYFKRRPSWRKMRAYLAVHGPKLGFICLVIAMELAFGIWQLVKYQTTPKYRAAFGWGVVMAKTCAGTLYPTFFFLILSMSRYLSTFLRRWYHVSRFFSWGLSPEFHIIISCFAILLATLHTLGHLTGSFVYGSGASHQNGVAVVLGQDAVPRSYVDYVRSVPGFTGIAGLGLFYILSLLSIPQVRRWNYEIFQLGHLLMFPIIGLMIAHGTAALLQWPMFGYFLAFPTLLVLVERVVRVFLGFHRIKATLKALDDDTVEITAIIPSERIWKYRAGQYIFLQVPKISFFQWHPFTISFNRTNKMMVHIKTDGDWTGRLRKLAGQSGESEIDIGVNGPFGAPAQHFYDFKQSIIIGAGIGVTPFAGILADLQHNEDLDHGGPDHHQGHDVRVAAPLSESNPIEKAAAERGAGNGDGALQPPSRDDIVGPAPSSTGGKSGDHEHRRVDFHWVVRDRNYLLWFSDLLNEVSVSQLWHHEHEEHPHLDIRINTHVTAKRKAISTHIYRWLLEMHRTDEHPASALTGLLNPTHFGRPDMDRILDEHYGEMREFRASKRQKDGSSEDCKEDEALKVGVFYCGAPAVGEILADKCSELTARGRYDGSKIEYHFLIEVF